MTNGVLCSPPFTPRHTTLTYTGPYLSTAEYTPLTCTSCRSPFKAFETLTWDGSIAHLVGFALKLRNLGVTDHGLIRELSQPLAGSLYSGEGHSRLYDDEQVYE
jgi:hypothetical protein